MVGDSGYMIYSTTTTKQCAFMTLFCFLSLVLSENRSEEAECKILPGGLSNGDENENKDPKKQR